MIEASNWLGLAETAKAVNSKKIQARDLVKKALQSASKSEPYGVLISTCDERALSRAEAVDSAGSSGRLAGVPFIAKDNFLTFGGFTTAGSNMLKPFKAPYQASVINMLEAEGAICIGKANLDAFAHGSSTENSDFMITRNPYDKNRVAGGSSGGSAAAVALGITPFAIGTDTGGSIRLPASFCGVVGYKPTYGLVSRSGVVAMASSTDVVGPLTANVEDAALVLDIMSGYDGLDSTLVSKDDAGYQLSEDKQSMPKLKVGVVKEYIDSNLDKGVRQVIDKAVEKIVAQGAEVSTVSLPSLPLALAVYYVICPAEVSSNLSRYDGQRYGFSDPQAKNLEESYELSRSHGFGDEAKRRIMIGTHVLSSGYYEAYYKKAQTVRTKIINEFNKTFSKYDFLVGPVSPETAFKIGQNDKDPLKMYLADIMTVAANISGVPSISLPAGFSEGLPVGLQIIAKQGDDRRLLQFSAQVEGSLG